MQQKKKEISSKKMKLQNGSFQCKIPSVRFEGVFFHHIQTSGDEVMTSEEEGYRGLPMSPFPEPSIEEAA